MGQIAIPVSGGRTTPTIEYQTSGTSRVHGFLKTFTLSSGYYYINVHFDNNPNKVTGQTTWNISGATEIYVDNGKGNYSCNALYQGLFQSDGSSITISCTNDGSSSSYPYVLVVYKVG